MGQIECGWKLKGAAIAVGLFLGCAVMCSLCGCSSTVQAKSRYAAGQNFGDSGATPCTNANGEPCINTPKQWLPCCDEVK